eukprot:jgi/Mesvir1/17728/Mv01474-RA.1
MQCKGRTQKGAKCRKRCRVGRSYCGLHGTAAKKRRHVMRQEGEENTSTLGHDLYTGSTATATGRSESPRARDLLRSDRSRKLTPEVVDWKKMADSYIPEPLRGAAPGHDAYVDRPHRDRPAGYRSISPASKALMDELRPDQPPEYYTNLYTHKIRGLTDRLKAHADEWERRNQEWARRVEKDRAEFLELKARRGRE